MSHVAQVTTRIHDLDAFAEAAAALGLEFRRDQTSYRWYGRFMNDWNDAERAAALRGHDPRTFGTCVHAVRARDHGPNDYEIGLVRPADGGPGFEMLYDSYGPGRKLEGIAGRQLKRLSEEYGIAVASKKFRRQGFRVDRQTSATGQPQLRIRK